MTSEQHTKLNIGITNNKFIVFVGSLANGIDYAKHNGRTSEKYL